MDSRLRPPGLKVDVATANVEVRKWLRDIVNTRLHDTTACVPAELLVEDQRGFLPLAGVWQGKVQRVAPGSNMPKPRPAVPIIQHPLSVYESFWCRRQCHEPAT